ncbi:amidohydrolase family protein [candidate division CSSED10-310 bacterium]|uniref:Amidohydrolase family protein n=1 Tax=candidate division CSSED10-310 bacterium TaxID=2855610 RepID=A0ABV6YT35_UNCC1
MVGSLKIINVRIFDVFSGQFSELGALEIKHGIFSAFKNNQAQSKSQQDILDGQGGYLIPGLIDCHCHILGTFANPEDTKFHLWLIKQVRNNLRVMLLAGVTAIRDMLAPINLINSYRRKIYKSKVIGPRIFTAGPMFSVENGYPYFLPSQPWVVNKAIGQLRWELKSESDIPRAVLYLKKKGVNHIKIYRLHQQLTEEAKPVSEIPLPWLLKICDAAHAMDLPVACHHSFVKGFREILELPIDTLEHLAVDGIYSDQDVQLFKAKNIYLIPTIKVMYDAAVEDPRQEPFFGEWLKSPAARQAFEPVPRRILLDLVADRWNPKYQTIVSKNIAQHGYKISFDNFRKMHQAGVKMAMGTDSGVNVCFFPHAPRELEHMVRFGMSPAEALRTGTINGAEVIGLSDRLGSITPGKWADCVLLRDNPLENITRIYDIQYVIKNGIVYDPVVELQRDVTLKMSGLVR